MDYKVCCICKKEKTQSCFNKNKAKKDGLNTLCRECSNASSKEYYARNQKLHSRNVNIRKRVNIKKTQQLIFDYFKTHPCVDCGATNPVVLEFDHRDTSTKYKIVSLMIFQGYAWSRIQEEINKCDVRCANCHRIRTSVQFGWYKNLVF